MSSVIIDVLSYYRCPQLFSMSSVIIDVLSYYRRPQLLSMSSVIIDVLSSIQFNSRGQFVDRRIQGNCHKGDLTIKV